MPPLLVHFLSTRVFSLFFLLTSLSAHFVYSETCLRRPLKGPSQGGLCYQVVSLSRVIRLERASLGSWFQWSSRTDGRLLRVVALTGFIVYLVHDILCRAGTKVCALVVDLPRKNLFKYAGKLMHTFHRLSFR